MKTLVLFAFCLISFFPLSAQDYYLQAGKWFIILHSNGDYEFDENYSTRFKVLNSKIYNENSLLFMADNLNSHHQIDFTSERRNAPIFLFEEHPAGGWIISRYFSSGKFYLIFKDSRLIWYNTYVNETPVLLRSFSSSNFSPATSYNFNSYSADGGRLTVRLKGSNNCNENYVKLIPLNTRASNSQIRESRTGCTIQFTDLPDGKYKVNLYERVYTRYGASKERPEYLIGQKEITIKNGITKYVSLNTN